MGERKSVPTSVIETAPCPSTGLSLFTGLSSISDEIVVLDEAVVPKPVFMSKKDRKIKFDTIKNKVIADAASQYSSYRSLASSKGERVSKGRLSEIIRSNESTNLVQLVLESIGKI